MSSSTTASCTNIATIAVIDKHARCYYFHKVTIAFTDPPAEALEKLRLKLSKEGLLTDKWYHLAVFSAVTLEIAQLSSVSRLALSVSQKAKYGDESMEETRLTRRSRAIRI